MKNDIRKTLEQTYEALVRVALYNHPLSEIEPHIADDFMGYGTATDETVSGWQDFKWMIERQREEMGHGEMTIKRIPVVQESFSNDHSALIVEEFEFTIVAGEEQHGFTMRLSTLLEYQKDRWMIKHFHGSTADADTPEGNAWPIEEWKRRNAELQRVVAEKTSDLLHKNKELEIEAALEKVRSRTMAMQHSDELPEAATLLSLQVQELGIPAWSAGYNIWNEDKTYTTTCMSSGVLQKPVQLPSKGVGYNFYDPCINGASFHIEELGGDELVQHYEFMRTLPDVGEVFDDIIEAGFPLPTLQIRHVAYFPHGYLQFITSEPVPEAHEIFKRFAKVFEQTYTRFLDLKKAEEQAKEAQIETALEKVRSRSLAMHHSGELGEVITIVIEKLRDLGFYVDDGVALITFTEGSKDLVEWMANPGFDSAMNIHLPYFEHPVLSNLWKSKNKGEDFLVKRYNAEENKSFLNHIFEFTEFKNTPQEVKDHCLAADSYATSIAFQKNTAIFINDYSGLSLSEEEVDILKRFAKVFEQAYIRFLDLQKAEAQAREAQIEVAIEKVRSRTMAMQHSDELPEIANILFLQVQALGIPAWSAGYNILSADKSSSTCIMSSEGQIQTAFHLPLIGERSFENWYEAINRGDPFFVQELGGKELEEHYQYLMSLPGVQEAIDPLEKAGISFPTYQINHLSLFNQGFLLFITYEKVPEAHDIFKRFTGVFEQTYTRFLDLKKAEAQTREARIETGLERVRARTMAMQKSEELREVIQEVFEQMVGLNINVDHTGFIIDYKARDDMHIWLADQEGVPSEVTIPYFDCPHWNSFLEARKKGSDFFANLHSFEAKNKFYNQLFEFIPDLDEEIKTFYLSCAGLAISTVLLDNVGLYIENFAGLPYTDEENDTLMRFGNVFQQTYTRFLDLQKAEAQAREAQIELGLERVRARAMAMQNTNELSDLVGNLLHELTKLDFSLTFCIINIYNEPDNSNMVWAANPEEGKAPESYYMKFEDYPFHDAMMREWKAQTPKFVYVMEGKEKEIYDDYLYTDTEFSRFPKEVQTANRALDKYVASFVFSQFGGLQTVGDEPLSDESIDILYRFGKVFDLTYTRFNDLQKAEAQAKEAQIEAALERVRAASMAMHKTDELAKVVEVLFQQFSDLELDFYQVWINIFLLEEGISNCWFSPVEGVISEAYTAVVPLGPFEESSIKSWRAGEEFSYLSSSGLKAVDKLMKDLSEMTKHPSFAQIQAKKKMDRVEIVDCNHKYGVMAMAKNEDITDNDRFILKRFTKVFEQAYTRFLDLQKAEAQAREAQIEVALEQVRFQAMAMRVSDDLESCTKLVFEELEKLDLTIQRSGIGIFDKETRDCQLWTTDVNSEGVKELSTGFTSMTIHPMLTTTFDAWLAQEKVSYVFEGQDLLDYYKLISKGNFYLSEEVITNSSSLPKEYYFYTPFVAGGLYFFSDTEPLPADKNILSRFAEVFHMTYTRFLDLQKAEAQAREAQIETALEKVRSRSLAMHKPVELQEVVAVVAEKLQELGVILDAGGVIICTYFPDNKDVIQWIAAPDFSSSGKYLIPYFDDLTFNDAWESKNSGDLFFTKKYSKAEKNAFFEYAFEHTEYKNFPDEFKQFVLQSEQIVISFAWAKNSAIMLSSHTGIVPSESDIEILKRFAKVFEQAYIRFMDLQNAEAQAREAQIETALEKVRSRTMAMQHSDELPEAANGLFLQVQALGIPAWSAGYCIWENEEKDSATAFMSSEGVLQKPFSLPAKGVGYNFYDPLRNGASFHLEELGGEEIVKHYEFMRTLPIFGEVIDGIIEAGFPLPTFQIFHILYFPHGYLMFITYEEVHYAHDIFKRFAKVFEQTYTRFLDLQTKEEQSVKLREEKVRLEKTLHDLQVTQAQLIQAEKMASLGELTAGIAHEIQNPLNFVNNFSEVSGELLDEMKEELTSTSFGSAQDGTLSKQDGEKMEDVMEIIDDLKQNLEKIHHHGGRADSIVKGMLQHSRTSTGEKEPTDINELADEYLRLAYHGLRAKDPSFNAAMETSFDESIGKINVIPQDIGRVLLNLITNAFQATHEKSQSIVLSTTLSHQEEYKPLVTVSTKRAAVSPSGGQGASEAIHLIISDNGPGIPDNIKDKIFQPFFTTKPTGEGTGLGLSLAYDIIKAHGGELTVSSEEGKGTEFKITLPIV